ncbi:MAG: hypothetical protein XD87_0169 [candidate division WS6 bacterium 36_33]|uniref:Uncharacterized protein n=1 Tax=candidate division WS6 bacterium 36_33 TaxID=1641388 RepID=A0A117LTY9_9BACT|nr:MAG: hypothetical protein XD87_0169 [candidate division WS6 bacterium 36_33]
MSEKSVGSIEGGNTYPKTEDMDKNIGMNMLEPTDYSYQEEEEGLGQNTPQVEEISPKQEVRDDLRGSDKGLEGVRQKGGINKGVLARGAVALGLLGGLMDGASAAKTQKNAEKNVDTTTPISEQYHENIQEGFVAENNAPGFSSLDSSIESGLDSERLSGNLPLETSTPDWLISNEVDDLKDVDDWEKNLMSWTEEFRELKDLKYLKTTVPISGPGYFSAPDDWELFSCNALPEELAKYHKLPYIREDNDLVIMSAGPQWLERVNRGNYLYVPFELYTEMKKVEEEPKCVFFTPSPKEGLDSEESGKEGEMLSEKEGPLGDFIDINIVNTLDITNWNMYELASITENIKPESYLPRLVSYIYYDENGKGGVLSPSLYVIPTQKEGAEVNRELPVLQYNLVPALFRPLEIAKEYKVVTPKGDEIILGAPKESEGEIFNGKFLVLMEITTSEGETVEFMNPEISPEETQSLQRSLWKSHGPFGLDFTFWGEKVILSEDSETKDFEQLMNSYDPESLRIGEKYNSSEIASFLKVFESEILR